MCHTVGMTAPRTSAPRISAAALERLAALAGSPTDSALASHLGISRATLYRLRAGDAPSLGTLSRMARAFALEPGDLLERRAA